MHVALLAGAGVGFFAGNAKEHTITTTSTFSSISTATITVVTTSTSVQTISTDPCVILGQPAGMFLKIASDNGGLPIAGAQVIAIHRQADDYCNGVLYRGNITMTSFTTNGTTAWYPLDSTNDGGYSIVVEYTGHLYNISAQLHPVSVACASLFIPSGRTNVTSTEFKTTCP